MPLSGEYEPSPTPWVREQVEEYERSGGTSGTTLRGMPVILLTTVGARSGKLRKVPLMRVEHDGGTPRWPPSAARRSTPSGTTTCWPTRRSSSRTAPHKQDMVAREVTGEEKALWWERCVAAFPDYADYQEKTDREIPVFVLEPIPA